MAALSPSACERLDALARDAHAERARIANWWARHSVDGARGGFHGAIGADGAPVASAEKSVILNTRLLWFFSEAAHVSGDADATALANRAAAYVGDNFFDAEHGGLFWMLGASGRPTDRRKQAYAQAFGLYALAAHYAATGDEQSLQMARSLFDVLEHKFFSTEHDGYWEARDSAFEPIEDVRLSARDLNAPLTMNTHLHVLEAYTQLYAVLRAQPVADALARVARVLMRRVYDRERGHLQLFFDANWRSIDGAISFGHDIEASWLLWETAERLGDAELQAEARQCALRLAESTLTQAIGPNGEVFEDIGATGNLSKRRVWWIQAEALVGFLNAFELSGDERFLDAAFNVWRFIQRFQIDPNAEWRATSSLDAPKAPDLMAGPWKCPYHTGRAMIETERRARAILARAPHFHHASRA
jgi:mannobiose 2-epimerase